MPHKLWAVGEEVLAADFQTYLQDQTVPVFLNVVERDTWAAPPLGALCVTSANGKVYQYTSAGWVRLPPALLGYVEKTTAQPGIGNTSVAITGLTLTATVPVSNVVEIAARFQFFGTAGWATDSQVLTELKRDGVTIQRAQSTYRAGNAAGVRDNHEPRRLMTSDGLAHTYTLWVATVGSGNVISTEADVTYPSFMTVRDLGRL
jgi:hypothetical protein